MQCTKCNIEMIIGKVIYPYELNSEILEFRRVATAETLKLVDCWKCPNCGKSEEIKDN